MKQLLRRWLGIDAIEIRSASVSDDIQSQIQTKVAEGIQNALNDHRYAFQGVVLRALLDHFKLTYIHEEVPDEMYPPLPQRTRKVVRLVSTAAVTNSHKRRT